jgi:NAD(P)-dependent dehydrogenase (short-subunit alcohol dehydrogenase family)
MSKVGILGARSTIATAFRELLGEGEEAVDNPETNDLPRYLITKGYLAGHRFGEYEQGEIEVTWRSNYTSIAQRCDKIIATNPDARICIIGSESGYAGSFDMAYGGAKAAMHLYIQTKRLTAPGQQLVGIAPTVIEDSEMTQRRVDFDACIARGEARRRGHWLRAMDVARLAHFLLFTDDGTVSNVVIRQNGGNW